MNLALEQLMNNRPLWISVLAFATAQLIKIILALFKSQKISRKQIMASGGMPSSHSAFVCAMSISVGKTVGFDTPLFCVAAVISLIVMYDAAGVRRSAGEQAVLVNIIIEKIEEAGIVVDERLKEFLGHRPVEVAAGAILGIGIAVIF